MNRQHQGETQAKRDVSLPQVCVCVWGGAYCGTKLWNAFLLCNVMCSQVKDEFKKRCKRLSMNKMKQAEFSSE